MKFFSSLAAGGLALAALAPFGACVRGDVVYLDDGSRLEGAVHRTPDGYTVVGADGKSTQVTADHVKSIELKKSPGAENPDAAGGRLASLRRSVEALNDPKQAIDRYQKFIANPANATAADEAGKDLAVWQDRADRGLVKSGGAWVTAEERAERSAKSFGTALTARDALAAGRLKDATAAIDQALADDPGNAAALFLRGVMLFGQDQTVPARKSFEAVNEIVPNHGPTLNNLAVILWRQRAYPAAMNYYAQAMQSAPARREILDNVAEALNTLPEENKESPPAKRAAALFADQDAQLQKSMSATGWFRWGATWVNAQQLDELKAAEAKVKVKLDALQAEFDTTKFRVGQIDQEIETNTRQMHRIEASSYTTDANGQPVRVAYPPSYFELAQDNEKLAADRTGVVRHLDELRAQAHQVQQSLPVPKFTGTQRLIGAEAMPVPVPVGAPGTAPGAGAVNPAPFDAGPPPAAPAATQPTGSIR